MSVSTYSILILSWCTRPREMTGGAWFQTDSDSGLREPRLNPRPHSTFSAQWKRRRQLYVASTSNPDAAGLRCSSSTRWSEAGTDNHSINASAELWEPARWHATRNVDPRGSKQEHLRVHNEGQHLANPLRTEPVPREGGGLMKCDDNSTVLLGSKTEGTICILAWK